MYELIPTLSPMLFYESEVFDSKEHIFELKFDGARCLAYLFEDKTYLINKRKKDVTSTYPELTELYKNVKKPCILDGELIVMENGKPNFFHLQKRALTADRFKIKLLMEKFPVTFIAFDILYYDNKLIIDLPLIERKKILTDNVVESSRLVVSRYIEEKGFEFFELAKKNNLEGIVAKEKQSKYYPGKRSRVWQKIKVYEEADLIICGYVPNEYGMKDVVFGAYDSNNQLYRAATIMTNKDKNIIIEFANKYPSSPLFDIDNDDIVWMKPHLVGRVQYMMKTNSGGLRQAVFLGVRDDKFASDLINNYV